MSYARLAASPVDSVNLAVLGYATGHTFDAKGIIARVGRWIYPTITTRPAIVGGMKVKLNPSDVSHMVIFEEVIRYETYDFDLIPFHPDLIIDCGGHIGLFTLQAAYNYPLSRLIVFEPNPDNSVYIKQHAVLNNLKIELVEAAVSRYDGEQWFRSDCSLGGTLQLEREQCEESYRVKVINLPALVRNLAPEKLLIKIDIEGEEISLFPSLIPELPRQCSIFFETHDGEEGWMYIAEHLTTAGFAVQQTRCRYPYADGFAIRS